MIEYRPVLFVIGILLSALAIAMLIPAVVDLLGQSNNWGSFFMSAFLTAFVGIALILTNQGQKFNLNLKQAFILTAASWFVVVAFSALPFLFSELKLSYTDAFFEAMSGITTTGASVIIGLDYLPKGILLWRSLLTAIGGIGIIVFALAISPMLRIGGMQLFKTESSDKSDKIMSRMAQVSISVISVYILLVALCGIGLWLAGMSAFDAINHAFSTISTAGFSTHDTGFSFYNSAYIDYTATLFMAASGIPFVLYVQFLRGDGQAFYKDEQVKWYLCILAGSILIVTIWLYFGKNFDWLTSLRYGTFNVTSVITTTGFTSSSDYASWGSFITTFLFMLCVVGGCNGSTTGGIKTFRFQVLYQTAKSQLVQLIQPHAIVKMRYNGKAIPDGVTASVMSFIILYGFAFMMVAIVLSFSGLDFLTSMSASAACLSNSAHGLGHIIGPNGNYSTLPDLAKWVLSFAMLLGRLEIFTILVLFSTKFWKG